jgi:hypothetical protein
MTTEKQNLRLDQIRIDGGTQPRVAIDQAVVDEYAGLYEGGIDLPPIIVFFDGATYWLADGFHRYWANRKIDCNQVFAYVHQGTQRDAQWYSFGANANHGLRRTQADVAHILKRIFSDEKWSTASIHEIVAHTGIPKSTVHDHRQRILSESGKYDSGERTFIHPKTGKPTTMRTANIGRKPNTSPRRFQPKPGLSRNAMTPIRGHSTHQPKTALELPHDPHWACRAILSAMGHDFARALVKELTAYLEGASE